MVMTQTEIIKEILTAGELEAVSDKIEDLSGVVLMSLTTQKTN